MQLLKFPKEYFEIEMTKISFRVQWFRDLSEQTKINAVIGPYVSYNNSSKLCNYAMKLITIKLSHSYSLLLTDYSEL